jgi:hypothetical protein
MKKFIAGFILFSCFYAEAQTNDTPMSSYQWKKNKTIPHDGYVVLKSGKRMEGQISLEGSPDQLTHVNYKNGEKELQFPLGSLTAFGLTGVIDAPAVVATAVTPPVKASKVTAINDSPKEWYGWHGTGAVIMGKVISITRPRPGYVVLKNGKRYEGELTAWKKDDELRDIKITTAQGKEKFDAEDIQNYGLTVTQEDATRMKMDDQFKDAMPGYIITSSGKLTGQVKVLNNKSLIFKGTDNAYKEYTSAEVSVYTVNKKDRETMYTSIEGTFLETRFSGNLFLVYINPKPTTVNQGATKRARSLASLIGSGTALAVEESNNTDQASKRAFDSLLTNSNDEQLAQYADALQRVADNLDGVQSVGFANIDATKDIKKQIQSRLASVKLVQAGRKGSSSIVILNEEWFVINKKTNEKFIVYNSDYKKQMENLMMGCEQFVMLDKKKQKDLQDMDSMAAAFKMLDSCY